VEEALPSILKVKIKLKKEGLYQTKIDYSIKWPTCVTRTGKQAKWPYATTEKPSSNASSSSKDARRV